MLLVINLQIWNMSAEFGEVDGRDRWNKGFTCIEFLKLYLNVCVYACFGEWEERGLYFSSVSNVNLTFRYP